MIKLNKIWLPFILSVSIVFHSPAQSDTSTIKPEIKLSGFIDMFYAYDFNEPTTNYRQNFLYNHNRHNEFNLNMGIIKVAVEHTKYRANIALQAGTYPTDNYAAEPAMLKHVYEANAGISLSKKNNLWVDAGIFASHIGFESAISIDNWTLTRSLLADNTPYYLSGIKLTHTTKNLELVALVCNGWQRIQKVQGNSLPSFGTQIKYSHDKKIMFNWSTFIGTDSPDSTRKMRYFNNFYGQFQFNKKIGLIAGFDIGFQQFAKGSSNYNTWSSPVVIIKYSFNDYWATAIRGEYYSDNKGVIIPTFTINGFQTSGTSLNIDYTPQENVMCRLEGRLLNSKDKIFEYGNKIINDNYFIAGSIAIKFSK
ncbi:MAG: porin [Bacteroidota bacterium]